MICKIYESFGYCGSDEGRSIAERMERSMRESKKIKKILCLFLFCMLLMLAGCQKDEILPEEIAGETENSYQISYLNSNGTGMISVEYRTKTTDEKELIQELISNFQTVPKEIECQVALPEKVEYQEYRLEQSVLYLYFDSNYAEMDAGREILCRAALAQTLTQLPFVDYIMIYSGEQPLMDKSGNPVGMFSESDFISSITDVNDFEKKTVVLYFTDAEGTTLVPEERELIHNINSSMERLVVSELIKGPKETGHSPVLSSDTKILGIYVNENVCYLNFDESFLKNSLDVKPEIPIYAIVNSLSELSTINKIQITVNGSSDVLFRDTLPLNTIFERNLDYIGGK